MRISTRLKLVVLVPALMAIVIGAALLYSYVVFEKNQRSLQVIRKVINGVNELDSLVVTYLLYREERPRRQFTAQHRQVVELIDGLRFSGSEESRLVENIRAGTESAERGFGLVVRGYEAAGGAGEDRLAREAEERLQGQLLVKSRDVVSDALRLESLIYRDTAGVQRRTAVLIVLIILATTAFLTIVLLRTSRGIGTSIGRLQSGIAIAGTGDLTHRISMPGDDELAQLAKSLDRMTERLRLLTVSKGELEEEVEERKMAEDEARQAYAREKRITQILQKAIVPSPPYISEGYRVSSVYIPAFADEEVGGDFYDIFPTCDGGVGILIGDISGKGVEAAARATATRSTIRALAYTASSAGRALTDANNVLQTQYAEGFVTVFLAILDPASGRIEYSNAGHPSPAIVSGGLVSFLNHGNMPIGILDSQVYRVEESRLDPGDEMVLYTDGVLEARQGADLLGYEGIAEALVHSAHADAETVRDRLLIAAREHALGRLRDDTAIVVIERLV